MVPFHGRSQKLTRHKRIASSSSPKRSSRTPFCHRHLFPETFRALEKLVQVARHQQRIRHQEEERSAALLKLQQKEKEEEKEKQNRLMEERTEGEEVLKTSSLKTHNTLHAIEREIHNILEKHAPNLEGYVLPMTKVETGDSAGTPTTAILPPHHVHFYSSPFALIPSNFLFGMPAGPSSALPTSAPHPNVAAPLSPLPSVQSQEDQLHRAALREGSGQGSTPPVVRLTSVGGVETGRHQESLESQYEDRNAKKSERERVGGVPPLQMDQLSVLQEEEEGKPPAGKPLTEETLPPTSDLLPGGALKPSSSLASHELCKNRGGEGRAPVESLNVGVQWASPRDQETQHNYSVLASTAQSSVREDGSCSPAFSVNIVYPSAPEDVYTAAEGVPQTSSQLNENEALRTKTVSAQEEERCMPLTPSGQQLPSSHSDIPKSHEGNSHDKELNPKTDSHPKAGSSISSSSSPTATTTTDVGHSFFAGVPGMFYVCDDQGRFIPVADPSRAHLPLTPDGSQLRDPLYYVAGDSGVIPSSQVFSHPTSSTVHPPQCCPWNTFHDHSHEGRGVCGTHRRGVSRRRTTSSPGKGGLSWSMPPTPGTLGRSMRHGPVTSKDAQTTSSASTIHAQQHRHVSPYTSRLRQCSPSNRFQGDQNAGGRSSDDLPATGGPLGCSRLNPYCQVCRDRFRLVFVDENMNPVPMFTDGVSTTHVGGVRRREDRDSAGAIPSLSSASAGVRNDSVSLPVGAIPSYASPPQENPSCSGWSRPSTLRTRRTSQKSTTSRSAHNLGVACRYHGPYLFTEEEPQQTKGHSSQSSCRPLSLSSRRMDRCEGKRIVDVIDHREASSGIQERSSGHCTYPSSLPAAMQTKKPVSIHFDPARMPECLSKVEDQHSNSSPHQSAMNRERERRKKLISRIAQLRSTLERDSYSSAPYSDSHAYRDHREISQKNHMNHKHEVTEDGEVEEEEGGQESTGSRPSHWKSSMGMGSHVNDQGSVEKLSCVITGTGRGGSGKTIRAVEGQFVPVCFENTVGKPLGGC